jgi:hypothetical protein
MGMYPPDLRLYSLEILMKKVFCLLTRREMKHRGRPRAPSVFHQVERLIVSCWLWWSFVLTRACACERA